MPMLPSKPTVLTLALAALLITGDGPGAPAPASSPSKYLPIAEGAIKIALPGIAQPDEYSCGAAAFMSVCSFYGVGPKKIERFKRKLDTNPAQGTNFHKIIEYAELLDLVVQWKSGMSTADLDDHLRHGRPVICSIQAYADDPATYNDPGHNGDGHYVVAIGFDRDNYFFMDPSLPRRRGFLSRTEFVNRWHDNEGTAEDPKIVTHLGIALSQKPGGTPYLRSAHRID